MLLSIIVPTYNERENIEPLVSKIEQALQDFPESFEICFMDDSTDDTPEVLQAVADMHPCVRYVHRQQRGGLATAVAEGFSHSQSDYLIVMDADLQHPPEVIPSILSHLLNGVDIVIPSRFVPGGSDGGLSVTRKLVSWTARKLGQVLISRLRKVSDCTSGFFGFHRKVLEGVTLKPIGWKILIEILVRGHYETIHEIPYSFVDRDAGYSKMNLREQRNYVRHLFRLILDTESERRFYVFCLVGALGVVVNLVVMSLLTYSLALPVAAASVCASVTAMIHNFLWNDNVTWRGFHKSVKWQRMLQMPTFMAISTIGILITAVFAQGFHRVHWNELLGQLLGIIVATVWNFKANSAWTWNGQAGGSKHVRKQVRVTREKSRSTP